MLLIVVGALPAFANTDVDDQEMLGSGEEAPVDDDKPAEPEPVAEEEAVEVVQVTPDDDAELAATGLDSAAVLLIGLGLTAAGGTAVLMSRRRKTSV
jgi:LPXTG-motif cell wall-anchored protein